MPDYHSKTKASTCAKDVVSQALDATAKLWRWAFTRNASATWPDVFMAHIRRSSRLACPLGARRSASRSQQPAWPWGPAPLGI